MDERQRLQIEAQLAAGDYEPFGTKPIRLLLAALDAATEQYVALARSTERLALRAERAERDVARMTEREHQRLEAIEDRVISKFAQYRVAGVREDAEFMLSIIRRFYAERASDVAVGLPASGPDTATE